MSTGVATTTGALLHPGIDEVCVFLRPFRGEIGKVHLLDNDGVDHGGHIVGGELDLAQQGRGFRMRVLKGCRVLLSVEG